MFLALTWLPHAFLIAIDFKDKVPNEVHVIFILMAHSYSAFNPFLYTIFNPNFRNAVKNFFFLILRIKRSENSFNFNRSTQTGTINMKTVSNLGEIKL